MILLATDSVSFAQNRTLTRGAEPGELYFIHPWYGIFAPPFYDDTFFDEAFAAVYRLTENGKKGTIQYAPDLLLPASNPEKVMNRIHADATPGILYSKRDYSIPPSGQLYSSYWVSFDYGKNWALREGNTHAAYFAGIYSADNHSIIYRMTAEGIFSSIDYGQSWTIENAGYGIQDGDIGFNECEFYNMYSTDTLWYTQTCFNTYSKIKIEELPTVYGVHSTVHRGGMEGEIYISYWTQEHHYKVLFSDDNGISFRSVYDKYWKPPNPINYEYWPTFIPDREPGVFYFVHPIGIVLPKDRFYMKLCIYHYRDYGEILAGVYCHEFPKEYGNFCESVNDLSSIKPNNSSVLLNWSESTSSLPVEGYSIFRDDQLLNAELTTDTYYLDENLPAGSYEYYVRTHYEMDCISDSSNHTIETVELGINNVNDREDIILYPNPTNGKLSVISYRLSVEEIGIFDVYGRNILSLKSQMSQQYLLDVSELQAGTYFVKITTKKGIITKKIIKY
jgi:hypothetical protein